ncbi:HprK-related kinase B [Marinomonas sp.]|nr:HprK-related kinase B [Marinomonas sp.]MDB4837701.1 HprK-related kinase B [Marinomonas sp.]
MSTPLNNLNLSNVMAECLNHAVFNFANLTVRVHTNYPNILDELKAYYKSYLQAETGNASVDLYAYESEEVGQLEDWVDVPREAGKQGKKEGYLDSFTESGDFEGRWIKKFKTGMTLLQRLENPIAMGPCLANMAQIINFVNNQFLNLHLRQGYSLGHASGFSVNGNVTAIAAGSGGGKSTLMLRCLESETRQFITNDRILIRQTEAGVDAVGVAKLPRVNPGTLLHSHENRLRHILSTERQQQLLEMAPQDLWVLEEKYDVQIEEEYGASRVELTGKLHNLVMLDWSFSSMEETRIERVDLTEEPDVIEGLRKRPGPFYQDTSGVFVDLHACESVEHYCAALQGVKVFRLVGGIDFDKAYELIGRLDEL